VSRQKGCELCGDFPAMLVAKCHPTAPLRVEITEAGVLVLYCYLPTCNRIVARVTVARATLQKKLERLEAERGAP
jgi:hypothetical protein